MNAHSDISTLRIEFEQTLINQERKSNRANFHYEKKYKKHIEREREGEGENIFRISGKFRFENSPARNKTVGNRAFSVKFPNSAFKELVYK